MSNDRPEAVTSLIAPRLLARLRSGWTVVVLICIGVLLLWAPDLSLPLGNSDDGRIFGRAGIQARNFWDLGPVDSSLGARTDPFIRAEFEVPPRAEPPIEAVTYAHHPPLKQFLTIVSVGALGDSPPAVRMTDFLLGAATVAFLAALLRAVGMRWGPTLLALLVMVSTGFFYVYARMGISFSMLLALAATVAWLRRAKQPSRWALAGAGALAALTAMHSWIAIASLGLLLPWLFIGTLRRRRSEGDRGSSALPRTSMVGWLRRGWSPALTAVTAGALLGGLLTAGWLLNATDISELSERVAFRTGNDVSTAAEQAQFTFGEFLQRQWTFAGHELLTSWWLRLLFLPALIAGLIDRRTRGPVVVTLAVAMSLTFALQQGAWIHRLWNFPWVAPTSIGIAALADAIRRLLQGPAARLRAPLGAAAAAVTLVTLAFVVTGSTRDFYLDRPADAGAVLEQAQDDPRVGEAELVWFTSGIWTPRWISYYLDLPVWMLDDSVLGQVAATDVILVRNDRVPSFVPPESMAAPLAAGEDYTLISAEELANRQ
ncbi:MAG: glycosyltransferase family 39 protein [Acidimicrobiaceae bacterium]|nr:glycosyltransferase family 39 protein [Acidimicrobiaceae bacterium]